MVPLLYAPASTFARAVIVVGGLKMTIQKSTEEVLELLVTAEALRLSEEKEKREQAAKEASSAAAKREAQAEEDKAKEEEEERRKAAAADYSAIAAGLGKLTGSTVSFPEKTVFRDGRASAAALHSSADEVARLVADSRDTATRASDPASAPGAVLLTSRTDQLPAILAANSFAGAVEALLDRAQSKRGGVRRSLRQTIAKTEVATGVSADGAEATADSLIGAAVDLAVATFNLLSVETTVETSARTATELETQVPVIAALLAQGVPVVHETIALPNPDGQLKADFAELSLEPGRLNKVVTSLEADIKALPPKATEAMKKQLNDKKSAVEDLKKQIESFIEKAQTADPTTKQTPLAGALAAQRLIGGRNAPTQLVAVVLPARINADQVALKRRLFAPRVVVTASATIDLIVLSLAEGRIVGAGSCVGEHVCQVRFPMAWWGDDNSPELTVTSFDDDPLPNHRNEVAGLTQRISKLEAAASRGSK